jgi:sarcosine oxidase subunit alpha
VELLVVGAGREGLRAAAEAAARGDRVLVVEREPGPISVPQPEGVDVMTRATAIGIYEAGYAVVHERARPVERLWHVRARRAVLATGGHERPIPFADNDRPGVMLAGAAARYVVDFGVLPGERFVLFATRSPAHEAAKVLRDAGAELAAIVDVRPDARSPGEGAEFLPGWAVAAAVGDPRLEAVHLVGPEGERRTVACDLLLVSGGWNPALQLWRAIGGGLRYDRSASTFVPDGIGPRWLEVVGSAAGGVAPSAPYWFVPSEDYSRHFVDLQRDQTVADVAAAVRGGLRSVEHVKRATYIGTAIDQGRTSNVITAEIVNSLSGAGPGAQGPTSARPPYVPVSFAALAGPYRGRLLAPERHTPIHDWHAERGAVFENVGQWKRPRYFPLAGESMREAVDRECLAVRRAVGAMDASTLGKIEVVGPDAPAFLDRMYTNAMSTLRVGHIRYGLMLGIDGMVLDDGVAMRLSAERYLVTTTTGGAALVLDRFEEWLQTEWPELRVFCTSVTEEWATIAIAGPRARDVVRALGTDVDTSIGSFPFMTLREGTVAEMPARLARVSFSGELAYEVNVTGWHGLAMWEAVMAAGEPFGIAPYGTEAMHVLRAEKGFPIVGQETDGSVAPHDLGMGWIVNRQKGDFVGKRSLARPDLRDPDRLQLVGLLCDGLLPEGSQLMDEPPEHLPTPMVGHVTSSYHSAALGRPIALAMVRSGRALEGRTLYVSDRAEAIAATVAPPVFYDPEGSRRDG